MPLKLSLTDFEDFDLSHKKVRIPIEKVLSGNACIVIVCHAKGTTVALLCVTIVSDQHFIACITEIWPLGWSVGDGILATAQCKPSRSNIARILEAEHKALTARIQQIGTAILPRDRCETANNIAIRSQSDHHDHRLTVTQTMKSPGLCSEFANRDTTAKSF
jgi:hypothetical protein